MTDVKTLDTTQLQDRVNSLERDVAWLAIYNLRLINILRSVVIANQLNSPINIENEMVIPFNKLGEIFDDIAKTSERVIDL